MKIDAMPSHCEVMGCHRPATDSYLHALYARLVEFSTCSDHYRRLMSGRPVLLVGRPDDPDDGIVA